MEEIVSDFFKKHVLNKQPLILGLSGGRDSTALFLAISKVISPSWPLHVLYVDHGWRKESCEEAKSLERYVSSFGFTFHCMKLPPRPEKCSLEEWSRRERFFCFQKLAKEVGAQAILLAHHADDQVEVVFKRFMEGASIEKFSAMSSVDEREGISIFRPLLKVRRAEIVQWLEDISYFDDPTNRDCHFLRARMREKIFPFLDKEFGKNSRKSFLRISEEASQLHSFISEEVQEKVECIEIQGGLVVLKKSEIHQFLAARFIDRLCHRVLPVSLSREQLQEASRAFCLEKNRSKTFYVGKGVLYVECGICFIYQTPLYPISPVLCDAEEGECSVGQWIISWKAAVSKGEQEVDWIDLLQGKSIRFLIPKGAFTICTVHEKILRKTRHKRVFPSPLSLRPFVPAITQGFTLVADALSRYTISVPSGVSCLEVKIRLKGEGIEQKKI